VTEAKQLKIGIVGGTGKEGSALALRFGSRGYRTYLGSRSQVKAEEKALQLNEKLAGFHPASDISGVDNHTAIHEADIVFLSMPYSIETKVGAAVPVRTLLTEERPVLEDKILVDLIVPTKLHAPIIIDDEDLVYYRRKFGVGKTPSVTEEIYLFAYHHLKVRPRIVGAFKSISFYRIADVQNDLSDEILIWGFEDSDLSLISNLCKDLNRSKEPKIYTVPQIFWRSIEGVCEFIRQQSSMGKDIMGLTFSYRKEN
jgi:predicted dinucleotide-binding enzyme